MKYMSKYISDPIKFNEFKQMEPMSFVFDNHYFKLESKVDIQWNPGFMMYGSDDDSYSSYAAVEYTYTVGTIFTNGVLMQRVNIDDIVENATDEDEINFIESLNDDEFMSDMMKTVSNECKFNTNAFMKELKEKGSLYDNLLFHFAFYFGMVPFNAYTRIIFDGKKSEYQFIILATYNDRFNTFQNKTFPSLFKSVTINPELYNFHIQKLTQKSDIEEFKTVNRTKIDFLYNANYGTKGIYATTIEMVNEIDKFSKISTMVQNTAFVPMPFELKVDSNNNVATSSDEENKDYFFNRNSIISQYNKFANFIIFEGIFDKVKDLTTTFLENHGLHKYTPWNDCGSVKYTICIDVLRNSFSDCLLIGIRLMPSRLVFSNFTADFKITSFSINNHRLEIILDDGYNGNDEIPSVLSSDEVYNSMHHMFFSSPLNHKWVNPEKMFSINLKDKAKMGLAYISYLPSKPIKEVDEKSEFNGIEIQSYVDCNSQKVIRFNVKSNTKFFCDNKIDAKNLSNQIKKTIGDVIKPSDIFYPILSTPTFILYKSLVQVRNYGFLNIHNYDYIGIGNTIYNTHDKESLFDRVSSTDILNWQEFSYPFISGKDIAVVPITKDLNLLINSEELGQ